MSDKELVDGDYTLKDGAGWFTVNKFSVRIRAVDKTSVRIEVYHLNKESEGNLASFTVTRDSVTESAITIEDAKNEGFLEGVASARREIANKLGLL